MKIVKEATFFESLDKILDYIFIDSINRGIKFSNDLDKEIYNLDFMSFSHRKSIYFNNENIRDLIFKGYVIPYEIDEKNNQIIILDIVKYRKK